MSFYKCNIFIQVSENVSSGNYYVLFYCKSDMKDQGAVLSAQDSPFDTSVR